MKLLSIVSILIVSTFTAMAQPKLSYRLYEMRTYYAPEGKLETLLGRFRNHTTKLFEKHGMTNIGYWLPTDNKDNKLVYLLAYPNREARDASWRSFMADPAWQAVQKESEANGKIVAKVESVFLKEADFSPNNFANSPGRVFELRTYTASQHNLGLLMARFRNHTLELFAKHGMVNLLYLNDIQADNNLTYLLAHSSKEAAGKSFDTFRQDPAWLKAREASELLGKGPITSQIKSEFLLPTDFSPWQ
jgi:hypothetical protein